MSTERVEITGERQRDRREVARAEQESADIAWLSGPEANDALDAALSTSRARLAAAQVHEVHHRPGAGVTIGYDARVVGPSGEELTEYLLATTAHVAPELLREGVVRLERGDRVLHVWRHPEDPVLPGLAVASDVDLATARTGLDADPGDVVLELIGYRPMRRAVLSVSSGQRRLYLKVVRPDQLEGLRSRNRFAEPAGAPPVLDVWPESVLVFPQAEGEPLPELLARDGAAEIDPRDLLRTLDAIDPGALELPLRRPWAERSRHYADAACNVLPAEVSRIRALQRAVEHAVNGLAAGPIVPTHGDFHAANVLTAGGTVSALLDVDTIGPGRRVDDLACLVGHLTVLPCLAPEIYPRVPATITAWLEVFDEVVPPRALRARAAGVVLSLLASMPIPDSERGSKDALGRLAVAEALMADATR